MAPQDLPSSSLLLWITLVAHTISGMLLSAIYLPLATSLLAGITDTVLLALLAGVALQVQRVRERLLQTLTALAGCGALLGLVALPVSEWLHLVKSGGGSPGQPAILLLGLIAWSVLITAHILRHALSCRFFSAVGLAVLFYWISINIMNGLFPIPIDG